MRKHRSLGLQHHKMPLHISVPSKTILFFVELHLPQARTALTRVHIPIACVHWGWFAAGSWLQQAEPGPQWAPAVGQTIWRPGSGWHWQDLGTHLADGPCRGSQDLEVALLQECAACLGKH